MDVGATFPDSHATKEITGMGEDLGGTDPYLLSRYLEAIPGECSLRETLESLVHPTREANTSVSLTTYQGNSILPFLGFTDLVNLSELRCGGVGSSYAWSKGMGFETSSIKTRSARKQATLSVTAPVVNSSSATDSGALRGMEALACAIP
jgi:hypothetical protein